MALNPSDVPSREGIQAAIDGAVPMSVRRTTVQATNGVGEATFAFGVTFDAPPIVVAAAGAALVYIESVTEDSFTASFHEVLGGAPILNFNVRIYYIAMEAS